MTKRVHKKPKSKKVNKIKKPKTDSFSKRFNGLEKTYKSIAAQGTGERLLAHRVKIYDFMEKAVGDALKKLGPKNLKSVLEFVVSDIDVHNQEPREVFQDAGGAGFKVETSIEPLFVRGVTLLEKLSEHGDFRATSSLADILSSYNVKTPRAYQKRARAIILYEKVAKTGDERYAGYAHTRLAELYAGYTPEKPNDLTDTQRHGVNHNIEMATNTFDSPYGYLLLAYWLISGIIFPRDEKRGHEMFERAIKAVKKKIWKNDPMVGEVMFRYGEYVANGWGCDLDEVKGRGYIEKAAKLGHPGAQQWLADSAGSCQIRLEKPFLLDQPKDLQENHADPLHNPMASFAGKSKKARMSSIAAKIRNKEELEKLLQPLHALIGVAPVKRKIEDLVYLAHANSMRMANNINMPIALSMHAVFMGSPGTAKTTVARLYGHLLYELGFLTKGHLVEVTRNDLIGEYIGQTTPKVRAKIEEARGGVLFIDEAYSLVQDTEYDFGSEAVAELLQQMENNRENIVVVFAGYPDEMKIFLNTNPGLKSRVPNVIEFPDYRTDELVQIFEKFCRDAYFKPTEEAVGRLRSHLKKLDGETIRRMGNARGIRNILEETIARQSRRIVERNIKATKALTIIEAEDVALPDDPGKGRLRVV